MATTIYLPTSVAAPRPATLAPSPTALSGLRLAVLDNGKPNAGVVMARAAAALAAATGAVVAMTTKKGPQGRSANAAIPVARDVLARLGAEADLVITGSADCGSCTAYSVHDAVELEGLGKPTVVVTTTRFRQIAETMAADFGLPGARLLVLPHPIGGTDVDTLHRWADDAVGALVALFTGRAAIAPTDAGALDRVRALVQADGSDLEPAGFDESSGTLRLRLVIGDASCADCVMPADHLARVATALLEPTMPGLRRVTIDDPRELTGLV